MSGFFKIIYSDKSEKVVSVSDVQDVDAGAYVELSNNRSDSIYFIRESEWEHIKELIDQEFEKR